jgi:proteasome lid subunit RPN8/RPN11
MDNGLMHAIRTHAEDACPFEACGVLTTTGAIPCTNIAAVPTKRYCIASHELQRIAREHSIIGYYHSHIDAPAQYSKTDLEQANELGKLYVIASVIGGVVTDVRTYVLEGHENDKSLVLLDASNPLIA